VCFLISGTILGHSGFEGERKGKDKEKKRKSRNKGRKGRNKMQFFWLYPLQNW
jgi:hypothetical protein